MGVAKSSGLSQKLELADLALPSDGSHARIGIIFC